MSHGVFTEFVYKFYGAIVKLRGRTLLVCAPKRLSKKVLEASGFTTLEHIVFTEKKSHFSITRFVQTSYVGLAGIGVGCMCG